MSRTLSEFRRAWVIAIAVAVFTLAGGAWAHDHGRTHTDGARASAPSELSVVGLHGCPACALAHAAGVCVPHAIAPEPPEIDVPARAVAPTHVSRDPSSDDSPPRGPPPSN